MKWHSTLLSLYKNIRTMYNYKTKLMKKLLFFSCVCWFFWVYNTGLFAQNDQFEKDVRHLLDINGSKEQFAMTSQQLIQQFKQQSHDIADSVWAVVKEDIIGPAFRELTEKMIPVYQKHFTHEEIKALIAFYESETGKMMVKKQPIIQREIMPFSQQWGRQLATDIQMKINGY